MLWRDKFAPPRATCERLLNDGFSQKQLNLISGDLMDLFDERRSEWELPVLSRELSAALAPYLRGLNELALELRVIGELSGAAERERRRKPWRLEFP